MEQQGNNLGMHIFACLQRDMFAEEWIKSNLKQGPQRFCNVCRGVGLLQISLGPQFSLWDGCQMPLDSLQALSAVLQTTAELRPRTDACTLTLDSTFAVPKCTSGFPQNQPHSGHWWQWRLLSRCNLCNFVRFLSQIISFAFPQESCVF